MNCVNYFSEQILAKNSSLPFFFFILLPLGFIYFEIYKSFSELAVGCNRTLFLTYISSHFAPLLKLLNQL